MSEWVRVGCRYVFIGLGLTNSYEMSEFGTITSQRTTPNTSGQKNNMTITRRGDRGDGIGGSDLQGRGLGAQEEGSVC